MSRNNRPTIAHVTSPYLRATETFIYDRIRHHLSFRPVVITTEPIEHMDIFPMSPVHSAASGSLLARKWDGFMRRTKGYSPFLERAALAENAKALVAHFGQIGVSLLPLARRLNLPLITAFYGHDASAALRDAELRRQYQELFSEAAIISVLSHDMKNRLVDAGCPPDKVRIHRLAFDTNGLPLASPGKPGPLRVMTNGRFVEKKGFPYLLEAFADLRRSTPNALLTIVGDGPLRAAIETKIMALNLVSSVQLAGIMPRSEVFRLMSESHLFILPSVTAADGDMEGTPMALIEASAAALPCITTRHAGSPEVIEDSVTGFVVPERDSTALADRLRTLAADPALRARMGDAARAKAQREFDIREVMRQMEADIRDAVKPRKG